MRRQLQVPNNAGVRVADRQGDLADARANRAGHAVNRREQGPASEDGQMFFAPVADDETSGGVRAGIFGVRRRVFENVGVRFFVCIILDNFITVT